MIDVHVDFTTILSLINLKISFYKKKNIKNILGVEFTIINKY